MPAAAVARHQQARLEGAMVVTVARHGYAGTTLRELVALAGVSRTTFYTHFESKRECFLATFDEIVEQAAERISCTYRSSQSFHDQLSAGLTAFMNLVVEEPEAARLVVVESMTLGEVGMTHREHGFRVFEQMIRESFDNSGSPHQLSDLTIKAIVAGIRSVIYRRLREGAQEKLPGHVDELVDWILCYQRAASPAVHRAIEAAAVPCPETGTATTWAVGWDEPPDSTVSRTTLTQRERILRAAARVVLANGYETLSIPAISGAAGVSNQTFYENFSSKREAFLASFEIVAQEALETTTTAFTAAGDRVEAVGIAIRALLEHIAGNELFSRLAFFEVPTAGPVALDRTDAMLDSYTTLLGPDAAPKELDEPLPGVIRLAIGGGLWTLIQNEIANNRGNDLPNLAPELTRIALAPFDLD